MYKVTIKKENVSLNKLSHLLIKNMINDGDMISFKTNKKGLEYLKTIFDDMVIEDLNKRFIAKIKRNSISILSILIIVFFLVNQNFIISEITYSNYDTENIEVTNFVQTKLKKVGPFYYLKESINDVNNSLRSIFYKYEWIGIKKRGSILSIEIVKANENSKENNSNIPGNLYSKYDSYIKMYHLEKGIVKVQEGMYVKKGDLLISGEINHYDSDSEFVHPVGYVIGEVLEYKYITVPKEEELIRKTGKIEKQEKFIYFNKNFTIKSKFENYETVIEENFHFFNVFKKITIYNYEIVNTNNTYCLEDAIIYGKSIIKKDFFVDNKNDFENIVFIEFVSSSEDDDNYYLKYILKSNKDITKFEPF